MSQISNAKGMKSKRFEDRKNSEIKSSQQQQQQNGKPIQSKKKPRGGKKMGPKNFKKGGRPYGMQTKSNKSCYLFTQLIGHQVTLSTVDSKKYEGIFIGSQYNPNGGIDVLLDFVKEILPLSRNDKTVQGKRQSLKFPYDAIVELDITNVQFGGKKVFSNGSEFKTDSEISKESSKKGGKKKHFVRRIR